MRRKGNIGVLAGLVLVLAILATGSVAQASRITRPPLTLAEMEFQASTLCYSEQSIYVRGGYSTIRKCSNSGDPVSVSGTVYDTSGDGYCIYVRVRWLQNGVVKKTTYSDYACPKGDYEPWSSQRPSIAHYLVTVEVLRKYVG